MYRVSFFFFQAEDGIRYLTVTGVQTCALPIFSRWNLEGGHADRDEGSADFLDTIGVPAFKIPSGEITNLPFLTHVARKGKRSEERRGGEEGRYRWGADYLKKKEWK